jgi:hypothetical protein
MSQSGYYSPASATETIKDKVSDAAGAVQKLPQTLTKRFETKINRSSPGC